MIDEDETYAEWLAEIITDYFAQQLLAGRSVIYESEIWQLLGREFPPDRENQKFRLKEHVGDPILEVTNENVVDFTKYKKKLN